MTTQSSRFCTNCGAAVSPDAAFCTSCGQPLAPPAPRGALPGEPPKKRKTGLIVGAVIGGLVVAGAAIVLVWQLNKPQGEDHAVDQPLPTASQTAEPDREDPDERDKAPEVIAKCGSGPSARVVDVDPRVPVLVTLDLDTSCADGDFIDSREWVVRLSDAGRLVAIGSFDLAREPIVIPREGAQVKLEFPAGSTWFGDGEHGTGLNADVFEEATSSREIDADVRGVTSTRIGTLAGIDGTEIGQAAHDALVAQSRAYDATVRARLEGLWSPQLSSKYEGLEANGKIWTPEAIWTEFQELRKRYPDALMIDSSTWSSYNRSHQFWVTSAGIAFPDAQGALDWCRAEGWDRDNCFAKRIVNGDAQGTTAYND
jgi:hypothetical protein